MSFFNLKIADSKERVILFSESVDDSRQTFKKVVIKNADTLSIGRTNDNNLCFENKFVSSKHAKLSYDGHSWSILDQGSTTVNKKLFADDGRYSISVYSKDAAGNVNENIEESKEAEISFGIDKTKPVIVPIDFESGKQYDLEVKTVSVEIKDNLVLEGVKIYLNGEEIEYKVDGETYTFDIPKSNSKQDVRIVAVDAAGNEQPIEITDFLVNDNFFVRWYNNTPLFIGSIIGVVVIALGVVSLILFGKKKKKEDK